MEGRDKKTAQDDLLATCDVDQKIFNTLKIFAECFVRNFESKSKRYYNLVLGRDEKLIKNVKAPAALTLGTIVKAIRFFRERTWNSSIKKRAGNLINQPFYKNPDKIREMLVTAAVCIFASYESQLIKINHDIDLEEITSDATERCFNYYKRKCNVMDASSAAVTKGVIRGKSKELIKKLPFKRKVKNTYVASLFEKVGLVTLKSDGSPDNYYKKKGGSTKHGYRLLLDWELESLYRAYLLNVEYQREKPPRISKYKYILREELMKKCTEKILNGINKNNLGLN